MDHVVDTAAHFDARFHGAQRATGALVVALLHLLVLMALLHVGPESGKRPTVREFVLLLSRLRPTEKPRASRKSEPAVVRPNEQPLYTSVPHLEGMPYVGNLGHSLFDCDLPNARSNGDQPAAPCVGTISGVRDPTALAPAIHFDPRWTQALADRRTPYVLPLSYCRDWPDEGFGVKMCASFMNTSQ